MGRSIQTEIYSEELVARVRSLGRRIRTARIRRKFRQADLAERSRLSKSTIEKIEAGELATSLGAYAQVLWVLQLDRELDLVANPGLDRDGLAFSVEHKRVMPKRRVNNDF